MDRREALKKMAVGGASVVGASVVLSNVAFADSGTTKCRHPYAAATFTATLTRAGTLNLSGRAIVTVGGVPGPCPCGGATPNISYAFTVTLSDFLSVTVTSGGWQPSNVFDTGALSIFAIGNFNYAIGVGIRLDCPGISGRAVTCRFATVSGTNAPTTPPALPLTSPPPAPAGLPSC